MNRVGIRRILVFVAVLCALLTVAAAAQERQKAEVFGGYQYTRIGGVLGANGWNAAITGNLNRWFGVTADLSGAYKGVAGVVGANAYTYTFGPTVSARGERVTPFAHVLLGGFHASAGFQGLSASTSGFAMMVGGGVDVKLTEHLSARLVQPDWVLWHAEGHTEKKNVRISTGIVFRF
jgi:hypothetical protein